MAVFLGREQNSDVVYLSCSLTLSLSPQEPEVVGLARFLNNSGACVEGAGSDTIFIRGKPYLHGCEFAVIPDRIEAGTFILAAAITRSSFSISPVIPSHLSCLLDKLSAAGCRIKQLNHETLEVCGSSVLSLSSL